MRNWNNYLNHQKYSECQLVTALNAHYYLTGNIIKQDTQEYEDLVDLCKARHGSAICIGKVYQKLGLTILEKHRFLYNFLYSYKKDNLFKKNVKRKKLPLPIEVSINHRLTGSHSILIVDHSVKCNAVRVTNFRYETRRGWMFIDDLELFEHRQFSGNNGINDKNGKQWNFRLFGLTS